MGVIRAKIQTVEDIYQLLRTAMVNKHPIRATYSGCDRWFCPHRLGRNHQGRLGVLGYQYAGQSGSGLEAIGSPANWRCMAVEKLSRVELFEGAWQAAPTTPARRPASQKWMWTWKISLPGSHRRKDSGITAQEVGGRGQSATWRSSADYAVRRAPGEPRGWYSAGIRAARSSNPPTRAEGGKRLRSITRKP